MCFARYDQTGSAGVPASFLAIYSLDIGPAKHLDRPWLGGIVLLPLTGPQIPPGDAVLTRKETIAAFNHVWSDELSRSGHPNTFPGLTWSGLVDCYIRFAGLSRETRQSDMVDEPNIDLLNGRWSGVLVPLNGTSAASKDLSLQFDKHGLISDAEIIESKTY